MALPWGLNELIYFKHLEQCLSAVNIIQCLLCRRPLLMIRQFDFSKLPPLLPFWTGLPVVLGEEVRGRLIHFLKKKTSLTISPFAYDSTQGFWPSCQCKKRKLNNPVAALAMGSLAPQKMSQWLQVKNALD